MTIKTNIFKDKIYRKRSFVNTLSFLPRITPGVNAVVFFLLIGLVLSCNKNNEQEQLMTLEENLSDMKTKTEKTLTQVRKYNVSEKDELRLVAYFYTNKEINSDSLAMELGKRQYAVNAGEYSDKKPWVINGKSDYIKMDDQSVWTWVEEMVRLGNKHNCVMDGWSTDPKQPKRVPTE